MILGFVSEIVREEFGDSVVEDTFFVADARVWTNPATQQIYSDSAGNFRIEEGILPDRYEVFAQRGALQGATTVAVKPGEVVPVNVILGEEPRDITGLGYDPAAGKQGKLPPRGRGRRGGGGG